MFLTNSFPDKSSSDLFTCIFDPVVKAISEGSSIVEDIENIKSSSLKLLENIQPSIVNGVV